MALVCRMFRGPRTRSDCLARVSIGILAWNEEGSIGDTIESLFAQSLMREGGGGVGGVEVVCVANGCTDSTAGAARDAFARFGGGVDGGRGVDLRVEEVEERGKENAWNRFVHEFSDRGAEFLILMDGDVRIGAACSLESLVGALLADERARIAGARTVKHVAMRRRRGVLGRVSLAASRLRSGRPGHFAGCLYAARAATLRRFSLPVVLLGEDSFVGAMVATDCFTEPADSSRVVCAEGASVIFEAYLDPLSVFRNTRRRLVELAINEVLYSALWASSSPSADAGVVIDRWNRERPGWDVDLVRGEWSKRGWWVVRRRLVTRHMGMLRHHRGVRRLAMLPVALFAVALNGVAALSANRSVRRGELRSLWVDS